VVPADDAVEHLRRRLFGVGTVEQAGKVKAVHDCLSSY